MKATNDKTLLNQKLHDDHHRHAAPNDGKDAGYFRKNHHKRIDRNRLVGDPDLRRGLCLPGQSGGLTEHRPVAGEIGAAGDSLWCRSFPWFMDATIYSADTDGNGDFYIGGIGHHASPNTVLMRMNASGDTVWSRTPTLAGNQFFNSIRSTRDGGVLGCGSSGNTFDSNRVYLVKYSASGSPSWQRTFGNYLSNTSNRETILHYLNTFCILTVKLTNPSIPNI